MANLLLIVSGGIAAYKSLDLIRRARERGHSVRVVMTAAAQQFVTPLAASAISGGQVYTDLWTPDGEHDVGHIRLSREADLIVIAPATADLLAKMAGGHADDLATAILLASDKKVLAAPAMNPRMWAHPATRRNLAQLRADGIAFVGPEHGEMAERGEAGLGRMAEPLQVLDAAEALLQESCVLAGRHVLVTSGPTIEPIDPVRFLSNRSSGRQGHAIAAAAARLGARVTLVSGPVGIPDPAGVTIVRVETAEDMLAAARSALPADIAVFAAAVADWRVANPAGEKIKKKKGVGAPSLTLSENPDILKTLAAPGQQRPRLLIGFAAETNDLLSNAKAKLAAKGCDWIVANDVAPGTGVMGGARNTVHVVSSAGIDSWPELTKEDVAARLMAKAAEVLNQENQSGG